MKRTTGTTGTTERTERTGKFYGVGVGPGEPELLTLKAVRLIRECRVLAVAISDLALKIPEYEPAGEACRYPAFLEKCMAYQIVLPIVPEIAGKAKLYLPMPMIRNKEQLAKIHDICADQCAQFLELGEDIAFITLGDPTVYSTCLYVQKRLKQRGYDTELAPGVPSFCAAAAKLGAGLVENQEELHILPASYEIEEGLKLRGTKVLMKAGRKLTSVRKTVKDHRQQAQMVENCGMKEERIFWSTEEIPDTAGYYSLMIVRESQDDASPSGEPLNGGKV